RGHSATQLHLEVGKSEPGVKDIGRFPAVVPAVVPAAGTDAGGDGALQNPLQRGDGIDQGIAGVASDALIDSVTALQWILKCPVPTRVSASGGNYRWHDGRETPDIFHARLAFPHFEVQLRCAMTT